MAPTLPPDEQARLAALRRYDILDTAPEQPFDDLTLLAATVCGTPIAAVTLVDHERQWAKASIGLPAGAEVLRDAALWACTVGRTDVLIIPDARRDARFAVRPPIKNDSGIRFYAGAPLLTPDGFAIGALCVADRIPRELLAPQIAALRALARQVISQLEMRRNLARLRWQSAQRAMAEEALRESESRFRRLSDASSDGIAVSENGIIREANQALCSMFGYAEEEVVGMTAIELTALPERDAVARRITEHDEKTYPTTGLRRDGSTFAAEATAKACTYQGRAARVMVVRDVTERMAVDRLKSEFVSTVSHELRTPLTSIRGSLGLLEGGVVEALPPRALDLIRIARSNSDRLIRLVNDILDLEKIESGKLKLDVAVLEPREIVAATVDGLRAMADLRRIWLVERAEDVPEFEGDRDRIIQVLTNLVSNAVKFSPDESTVDIEVTCPRPNTVCFAVTDCGPGISREHLPLLFQKFQQLDASDRRRKGGTGLGLAISRSIVEQHGGTIGVRSEPGVRTVFWFELPTRPA